MFDHSWGMMGFGWLVPLLIISVIFYLFQERKKDSLSAQDILDKRYANSEISKEEYEEKTKQINTNNKKDQ